MKKTITVLLAVFIMLILSFTFQVDNCPAQWVQMSNGISSELVRPLVSSGNNIFAGTDNSGVYLSSNNGLSWTQTSLNNQSIQSFAVNGNNIFAGTLNNGVYLSTNNGTTWNQTTLNNQTVRSLTVNGNNIFAGATNPATGVYLSTNNGATWAQTSLNSLNVYSLAVNGNNIFAGTAGSGVFLSVDNGTTWTQTSIGSLNVFSLAVNGNNIFAGTVYNGVYLSTNNGTIWTQTSLNNRDVYSLAINGDNIFAGTYSGFGVYVSNNNGNSWTQRNEGLINANVRGLSILNNYIFAGAVSNGVYRRPLNELITGIPAISNEVPNKFSLSQNYPNPFNPTTKISFDIPKQGFVSLKVFDVLGREMETLVNQQMNAGTYSMDFNGSKIVSGVYFYRLQSSEFTDVKKLVLIK